MNTTAPATAAVARDVRVIGLIGLAHFFSHFFQLVLPPLFPVLKDAFGVGYTELGLMMTLFYGTSGISQTFAGFCVDRFGAHRVLWIGTALLGGAVALIGLSGSFWLALPLLVLAGMGNSVYHPSDYAILTHAITPSRMGRAYSVHTLGGTLGWAAAPPTVLVVSGLIGWQSALAALGLVGIAVAALVLTQHGTLDVTPRHPRRAGGGSLGAARVLTAAPVLMAFAYFALLSVSLTGFQTFLPTMLPKLQPVDLAAAGVALTCYLVASGCGILVGGVLADRTSGHERIVAVGLGTAALLIFLVGSASLGAAAVFVALSLAGFLSGTTTPSRDMLVRAATPPGAAGKVFGFVYSGLDLGAATAPLVLGVLLDAALPAAAMNLVGASLGLTILSALILKRRTVSAYGT